MTITGSNGDSITFGRYFKLIDDFDLSGTKADVNTSETTDDGSSYQNTMIANKDFDIPFFIHRQSKESWWIEEKRSLAYRVFNPKNNPFRINFTTKGGLKYYIDANLESVPAFQKGFENDNRLWLKGLLQFVATDPYFYSSNETLVELATWIGSFEFPLEIPEGGIEMGYRTKTTIQNVINKGHVDTGMEVKFRASSSLLNPSIINVNTREVIKINFQMQGGDVIVVSTYKGKKTATLIRDNVETDIFSSIDLVESTFIQLKPGDNLFRYDCDDGIDNLTVSIKLKNRYLGV